MTITLTQKTMEMDFCVVFCGHVELSSQLHASKDDWHTFTYRYLKPVII